MFFRYSLKIEFFYKDDVSKDIDQKNKNKYKKKAKW